MKLQIAITLAALALGGSAFAQEPAGGGRPAPTPELQAARQALRTACAAAIFRNTKRSSFPSRLTRA